MYNKKFKKDYNNVKKHINKLMEEFPPIVPIIEKLELANLFAEKKNLDETERLGFFISVLEPHLDQLSNFLDYYRSCISLFDNFLKSYNNYSDEHVDGWMVVIVTIKYRLSVASDIIEEIRKKVEIL